MNRPGATEAALLAAGAATSRARFERDGALVRPDGTVASESQAYAMLRAVWSDDRAAFDRTWGWTRTHLLNDQGAALLAVEGRRGGRRRTRPPTRTPTPPWPC